MAYLSRNDIEAIAARVTGDYKSLPRFAGQPTDHIDPEILARELCGLSLDCCFLSRSGLILGVTAYDGIEVGVYDEAGKMVSYYLDGNTILVERSLKEIPAQQGRYHFTVMHETAHQILHRMFPDHQQGIQRRAVYYRGQIQRFPVQDWDEWQADKLASALLMPVDLIMSALLRFGLDHDFDIVNPIFRPKQYACFVEMAKLLGVSRKALAIRLKQLGLIKEEYLEDPYALVRIDPD